LKTRVFPNQRFLALAVIDGKKEMTGASGERSDFVQGRRRTTSMLLSVLAQRLALRMLRDMQGNEKGRHEDGL
jgi:hypothetical protein